MKLFTFKDGDFQNHGKIEERLNERDTVKLDAPKPISCLYSGQK
jgi:hypothetical protein